LAGSPAPEFSCDAFPCKQNSHSVALCIEKQYSEYERLPVAPDSRACSCMAPGHSYADDAAGCVGESLKQQQADDTECVVARRFAQGVPAA
jgi:hypothetical protein